MRQILAWKTYTHTKNMCLHFSQAVIRFYCCKFPGTNGKRRPKGFLWIVRLKKKNWDLQNCQMTDTPKFYHLIQNSGYILRIHDLFHFYRDNMYKVCLEYFSKKYFCAFFLPLFEGKRVGHLLFRYAYWSQALIFNYSNVTWPVTFICI